MRSHEAITEPVTKCPFYWLIGKCYYPTPDYYLTLDPFVIFLILSLCIFVIGSRRFSIE